MLINPNNSDFLACSDYGTCAFGSEQDYFLARGTRTTLGQANSLCAR
jgi:hypothetical protein